ncbi:prolipoprotein diacylglyceryl transferase [Luteolibacter flavescens]|uniref:Phosphatidylglycerol--prolipoprotein diacylglyceryl transferase n=1 Tax=Luteolibacter flavescens TaxID=1859460 RepID=A0ABT3FM22_9BACT|nr:prolipoprotein diacylglyceryl transferase [Luteolibacter flavescens]MCW1884608.1 prolipoprotein diacylglyceryl transferase [Luteolibacter flavescens]
MFATYVHDLSPVLIRFTDAIQLRWYGLAYLAAFLVGAWLLNVLAKRKLWVLPPGAAGDFIAAAAIFGVFIGGRVGYMLWYHSREHGWDWVNQDPLMLFKVWEGGMASHGGILGLVIFTWFYARKKNVSWRGLGDGLCVAAPLGLFFGRLANFWNGELYGRAAQGVAWAVKFPRSLVEQQKAEGVDFPAAMQAASEVSPTIKESFDLWQQDRISSHAMMDAMLAVQRKDPAVSKAIEPFLQPRHPSQLYEGLLEGVVLFAILWWVRNRFPQLPAGILTGLFFIFYALFRIFAEQFREPDSKMVGFMTSGQFLSLFMVLAGAAFIVSAKLMPTKHRMTSTAAPEAK